MHIVSKGKYGCFNFKNRRALRQEFSKLKFDNISSSATIVSFIRCLKVFDFLFNFQSQY